VHWGVLQVGVLQFASHADAMEFQDWIIYASCPNASAAFPVEATEGSVGLALRWSD
jgi:hypothetical protein